MELIHLRDAHGDVIIHKTGCAHIARLAQYNRDGDWIFNAETKQEAANEFGRTSLPKNPWTEKDALFSTKFAPCVTIK